MILKFAWPTLALSLSACASKPEAVQPIAAVAQQRQCPAYPLPPEALIKAPLKTDFLTPSSQRSRLSSSTN